MTIEITQRDREAAAALAEKLGWTTGAAFLEGRLDGWPTIRALAEARTQARDAALDEAAHKATSFLVGDPASGVPLRNPMAHEIATAIRSLKTSTTNTTGD